MCSLLYEQVTKDTQNQVLRSRYTRLRTGKADLNILHAKLVHGMIVPGIAVGDYFGPVSINTPDSFT